ncbi:MAG: HAD family phosphatase [Patescibacteria group bacterium]
MQSRLFFSFLSGLKLLPLANSYAFDVLVTSEDYIKGKPAPDAFLIALGNLNKISAFFLLPKNILVIEDSPEGVEAAKASRMICLAVTHTHTADQLKEADFIVNDLSNLEINNLTVALK